MGRACAWLKATHFNLILQPGKWVTFICQAQPGRRASTGAANRPSRSRSCARCLERGKKPTDRRSLELVLNECVEGVERVRRRGIAELSPRQREPSLSAADPASTPALGLSPAHWRRASPVRAASPPQPADWPDWLLIPSHTSKLKTGREPDQGRCHDVWEPVSAIEASYLAGTLRMPLSASWACCWAAWIWG
jgi:hypothetical protein